MKKSELLILIESEVKKILTEVWSDNDLKLEVQKLENSAKKIEKTINSMNSLNQYKAVDNMVANFAKQLNYIETKIKDSGKNIKNPSFYWHRDFSSANDKTQLSPSDKYWDLYEKLEEKRKMLKNTGK